MRYRRTVYETSKRDLAKVVTNFAKKKMPGRGFSCLMIGGTLQSGEKEVLELRFHTDFIPHVEKLLKELNGLKEYEEDTTKEMLAEVEEKVGKLGVESRSGKAGLVGLGEDEIDKVKALIEQMDEDVHKEDDPAAAQNAVDRLREQILNMTDEDGASVEEEPLCEDEDEDEDLWDLDSIADELMDETDPDAETDGDDDSVDSTP